jgi:hypothetical protein
LPNNFTWGRSPSTRRWTACVEAACSSEELFRVVDRLARAYSDYRVRIINFIHSSERDRDDRGE